MENDDLPSLERVYQMLFALASHNFNFRLTPDGIDSPLELLSVLLNMVAEELQPLALGLHSGRSSASALEQYHLFLDAEFNLVTCSPNVTSVLELGESGAFLLPFNSLLTENGMGYWETECMALALENQFYFTRLLSFKGKAGLAVVVPCIFFKNTVMPHIVVHFSLPRTAPAPTIAKTGDGSGIPLKASEMRALQRLHDYILEHLDAPLPTIYTLSRIVGSNSQTLKSGFTQLFKRTYYAFYNEERLKRALELMERSSLPLFSISELCGFSTYSTFFKAFRKLYGIAPGKVKRPL